MPTPGCSSCWSTTRYKQPTPAPAAPRTGSRCECITSFFSFPGPLREDGVSHRCDTKKHAAKLQKQPHHLVTATHSTCSPPCARCCPRRHRLQTPCMTFAQQSRSTRGARRVVSIDREETGGLETAVLVPIQPTRREKSASAQSSRKCSFQQRSRLFSYFAALSFSLARLFSRTPR